jgi:1-acyl-sn-glycerol-3-phosphate acyltransferase
VPWLARIAYFLFRYLIVPFYFGKIEVRGQKYLPKEGPIILAPTHRSRWDAIIIPYAAGRDIIGRDLRFMVWADEMKGLQGWFIRRLGGFPINPRQPEISSLRHGIKLLEEGLWLTRLLLSVQLKGAIESVLLPNCSDSQSVSLLVWLVRLQVMRSIQRFPSSNTY